MPIKIHDKMYKTVAERVQEFHAKYPNGNIVTKVESDLSTDQLVVMYAVVIPNVDNPTRQFTGYAEELRGSTTINKTSAMENCETSAVGRALAFAGFGGSEIASANEVEAALAKQNAIQKQPKAQDHDDYKPNSAKKPAAKPAVELTDKEKMLVLEIMAELEKCVSLDELALCASSLNKTYPKLAKAVTGEVNIGYKQLYNKLKEEADNAEG